MQKEQGEDRAGVQARLLEAALDIFGRDGYEAATTRAIASEAGANIAAIPYYYGGKEGLYQAVVSHIIGLVRRRLDATMHRIEESSFDGKGGKNRAWNELEAMLVTMIDFMVGSSHGVRVARIILREQMYPTEAYEKIFQGFMAPVLDTLTTLIIAITDEPSERRVKIRALAIIGQIMAFRVARESIVRALALEGYSADELEEIKAIVLEHTASILKTSR